NILFVLACVAIYVVSINKITEYVSHGLSAARPALYITGYNIMKDHMPIGSGFGTFASSLSGEYYSKIYYIYRISNVWGLTPKQYNYMADTFWPYIFGQFGLLGLILYLTALVLSFTFVFKKCKLEKIKICITLLILYLLFSSFVESILTNDTIILYILVIYIFASYDMSISKDKMKTLEIKELEESN
ncbi:MAG: hypothetical protein K2O05_02350, partial [Anaeroplasmataceae bacterium]|nr:hypothetical protein [Anaeroplasmataceae bacterium]